MEKQKSEEPEWFEEIDHTGDTGFRITANSLSQLFERAARCMFEILCDTSSIGQTQQLDIRLSASDIEALMVKWLTELNYLHTAKRLLISTFSVKDINENDINAHVEGDLFDPSQHIIHTEIKAVTYHGLYVVTKSGKWHTQVIFDM